ncbi:unnamed protein product [Phytophthora fragariaefolia]|uniref:Unnamed protein product n=1 Tax=Phytophthora fragariaefolia TaxID=1490495 RepID=A0A9W6YIU4_9STRA|nr:unnamed protein product [Phytophthora fragariaefolia]
MLDELFSTSPQTTASSGAGLMIKEASNVMQSNMMSTAQIGAASMTHTLLEPSLAFASPLEIGPTLLQGNLLTSSTAATSSAAASSTTPSDGAAQAAAAGLNQADADNDLSASLLTSTDATSAADSRPKTSSEKACLSTPASAMLDYSTHNRSCGHLSILHGNHHDYVVQNHLVCQDSVTRLGGLQRASADGKVQAKSLAAQPAKCTSPKDTHRPGCGHLPVRHKDHIDYVVEDSLICQQASWLEDDNLELLGDDFWDFYGAIDAFPTN